MASRATRLGVAPVSLMVRALLHTALHGEQSANGRGHLMTQAAFQAFIETGKVCCKRESSHRDTPRPCLSSCRTDSRSRGCLHHR